MHGHKELIRMEIIMSRRVHDALLGLPCHFLALQTYLFPVDFHCLHHILKLPSMFFPQSLMLNVIVYMGAINQKYRLP